MYNPNLKRIYIAIYSYMGVGIAATNIDYQGYIRGKWKKEVPDCKDILITFLLSIGCYSAFAETRSVQAYLSN